MSYCEHCVFSSTYRDMGASCPTCSLIRDLVASVKFRALIEGKNTCPYAIFFCDLVNVLDLSCGLQWSIESKNQGSNFDLGLRLFKKG